jgi:hypothetical protein
MFIYIAEDGNIFIREEKDKEMDATTEDGSWQKIEIRPTVKTTQCIVIVNEEDPEVFTLGQISNEH